MAKSWFYLTLWRGTPPEFTEEIGAEIQERDFAFVSIVENENTTAPIDIDSSALVEIAETQNADTKIITRTEVLWYVGEN